MSSREVCAPRQPSRPVRIAFQLLGIVAIGAGAVGIFLPLVPTVPFMLLAAFCFARGSPAWERRLLEHPRFGHHIRAWRAHGAIPRVGKIAAGVGLSGSATGGLFLIDGPWRFAPAAIALICAGWIATRPDA